MCSLEPGYVPGPDWQKGFIAGRVYDDDPTNRNPRFDFTPAHIMNRMECPNMKVANVIAGSSGGMTTLATLR